MSASPSTTPCEVWRAAIAEELAELARELPARVWERVLLGPAHGVLDRPGKQLRANLVQAGWRLAGGGGDGPPAALAAAIEVLHAGSLVIDDIEDDAELRRGAPALHRSLGMPLALNTGNWMYFFAFALVDRARLPEATAIAAHRAMLRAVMDCHRGQALDLGHDVTRVVRGELRPVVTAATTRKSGALTRLAAELGALAAGATGERLAAVAQFGTRLGTGLQMLDDLGAVTTGWRADKSREDLWGKRATWAWVWLAEATDDAGWARAVRWLREVAETRADPEPLARHLGETAARGGPREIREWLARARTAIAALGDASAQAFIAGELERLERAYV